jgi:hypothetical protein
MAWRWFVMAIAVAMALAVPFAHATPPDQTWLGGLYDNADYDDVVNFVTSASATTPRARPQDLTPLEIVTSVTPALPTASPSVQPRSTYHRRAPPLA